MLLDHFRSAEPGLNKDVVEGVIGRRVRSAYIMILQKITDICTAEVRAPAWTGPHTRLRLSPSRSGSPPGQRAQGCKRFVPHCRPRRCSCYQTARRYRSVVPFWRRVPLSQRCRSALFGAAERPAARQKH
jgi:hypothetical protein